MSLAITERQLTDINTISIPTDAIFTVSILIVFSFIGYFFLNILSNDTKQFSEKINADSKLKLVKEELEDRLALEIRTIDQKNVEKPRNKKLNFLPSAKLLGLSSLAFLGIGGTSLLGLQSMQQSYENINTNRTNIKLENQSKNHQLSVINLKSFYKQQKNIKKVSYIDPFLSTINSSKENHYYKVKDKKIENMFSF